MNFNDILNEEIKVEILNEAGLNYKGKKPTSAKVLYHDDMDGIWSAIGITMQLKKQYDISPNNIDYGSLSDKNYKNSNEKQLTKEEGQILIVVDFNRFDKTANKKQIDLHTDHHSQEEGEGKKKGQKFKDSYKSDAEHISVSVARGFMNSSDIKAISAVDSASFGKNLFTNHTLDLNIALKNEKTSDKKVRLAIVSNILLNQIVRAYKTKNLSAVHELIRQTAQTPTIIKFYSLLKNKIKTLKLTAPGLKEIADFKKDNEDRVSKSMDKDSEGNYKIKDIDKETDENKRKEQTVTKDSRFPDIAKNATYGGEGRYDAFLDKSVKAAFRDYGDFWQISKRPESKLDADLIKISKDAYSKAGKEIISFKNLQKKFYFEKTNLKGLEAAALKGFRSDYEKIGGHKAIANIGIINLKKELESFYKLDDLKSENKEGQATATKFEKTQIISALRKSNVKIAYAALMTELNRQNKEKHETPKKVSPMSVEYIDVEKYYFANDKYGSKLSKARNSASRTSKASIENKFYLAISNNIAEVADKTGMSEVLKDSGKNGKAIGVRQKVINKFLSEFKTAVNYNIKVAVQGKIKTQKNESEEYRMNPILESIRKNI